MPLVHHSFAIFFFFFIFSLIINLNQANDDIPTTDVDCSSLKGCTACLSSNNPNCAYCPGTYLCYDAAKNSDPCDYEVIANEVYCACLEQSECESCINAHEDCVWCASSPTYSCQPPHSRCLYPTSGCSAPNRSSFLLLIPLVGFPIGLTVCASVLLYFKFRHHEEGEDDDEESWEEDEEGEEGDEEGGEVVEEGGEQTGLINGEKVLVRYSGREIFSEL